MSVKNSIFVRRLLTGTIGLGGLMLSGAALAADEQAASASAPAGVQDIIVTAQKREQSLQKVPISITAVNADKIAANRIVDVRDLSAVAPNLTVRIQGGGGGNASFSMRGLVSNGFTAGQDKGISLYVDGVYIQSANGGVFELSDVERIEVLKGPQGTLFGRNSTGGAISLITRQPTGKFGVQQTFTYGNFSAFRSKTRVDLPEWNNLKATVSYIHSERRGNVLNIGAGTTWDYGPATKGAYGKQVSPKYLGGENTEAVSAVVKYQPTDNFRATYHYDYSTSDFTPDAINPVATNFGILNFSSPGFGDLVQALYDGQDRSKMSPITNKRPDVVNNAFSNTGKTTHLGHNLTAKWDVAPQITLTNILAYRTMRSFVANNLSGAGGLINNQPFLGTVGDPYVLLENASDLRSKQWSNEFQFNWNTDLFGLTAGYLHFDDRSVTGGVAGAPNVTQFKTAPGYVLPGNGTELSTTVHSKSDAWFAQSEVHLTSQLDVVGGIRATKDKKRGDDNTLSTSTKQIVYDDTRVTYLAGVNYRPASNILVYGKYSTGFISGGQLATLTFNPELAKSWEAGIKTDLLNRRLRANLALYTVKYEALQLNFCGPCAGVPEASQVIKNAGDSRAKGFELETTAVLSDNLTVEANVGFTDFHFLSLDPGVGNIATYFPENRPKWTANWSVQYQTKPLIDDAYLSFRLDANYRSEVHLIGNPPTAAIRDVTTVPDQVLVNARLALRDLTIGRAKGQIALWGKNLFDNKQLNNVLSLSLIYAGNFERARQFGVDVTFEM